MIGGGFFMSRVAAAATTSTVKSTEGEEHEAPSADSYVTQTAYDGWGDMDTITSDAPVDPTTTTPTGTNVDSTGMTTTTLTPTTATNSETDDARQEVADSNLGTDAFHDGTSSQPEWIREVLSEDDQDLLFFDCEGEESVDQQQMDFPVAGHPLV